MVLFFVTLLILIGMFGVRVCVFAESGLKCFGVALIIRLITVRCCGTVLNFNISC